MSLKRSPRWQVVLSTVGLCAIGLTGQQSAFAQDVPPAPPAAQVPALPPPPGAPDTTQPAAPVQPAVPTESDEDYSVLDSGPVHEAFAEPIKLNAEPDIVVTQRPPEPIEELPPETRPQGDNVLWISGYWTWTEEDNDFIWVSGIWRDVPPGQQWIPGYWSEVEGGFRWTHGFWSATASEQLAYLPPPPDSLDTGPVSPSPGDDHFYVPGCWVWRNTQYVWRPGFWHVWQPNWVWVPAHYCWTPRGYVFLNGYWDYPLVRRGFLFAPVRFYRPIFLAGGFRFTPRFWVNVPGLTVGLFVAPRRSHYFFGNYYGPRFANAGYYPWFQYHNRRFGYDPLFAYESSYQRRMGGGSDRWLADMRNDYDRNAQRFANRPVDGRDLDRSFRPDSPRPRGGDADSPPRFVQNVRDMDPGKFTRLTEQQRQEVVTRDSARLANARQQRVSIEARGPDPDRTFPRGDQGSRTRPDAGDRAAAGPQDVRRSPSDRSGREAGPGAGSSGTTPPFGRSGDRSQVVQPRSGEPGATPSRVPRTESDQRGPGARPQTPPSDARSDQGTPSARPSSPSQRQFTPPQQRSVPDGARGAAPQQRSTPQVQPGPPQAQRGTPQLQRSTPQPQSSPPQIQRSLPQTQRSAPQLQPSAPQLQRSAPPIQRSAPQIQQSAPQIQRSAPQIQRSAPQIQRSAPSAPPAARSPSFSGGGGSSPAFRGSTPSFRGSPAAGGGGSVSRGGGGGPSGPSGGGGRSGRGR